MADPITPYISNGTEALRADPRGDNYGSEKRADFE